MLLVRLHHNLHPRQGVEGGLAQLARAPALQAGGQRFESVILHSKREDIDILEASYTEICIAKQIKHNE